MEDGTTVATPVLNEGERVHQVYDLYRSNGSSPIVSGAGAAGILVADVGQATTVYEMSSGKDTQHILDTGNFNPTLSTVDRIGRAGQVAAVWIGPVMSAKLGSLGKAAAPARTLANVEACALGDALPSQELASLSKIDEYARLMKSGKWDWAAMEEKIGIATTPSGKKVVIDGTHRYWAAKKAGVKVPKSAIVEFTVPTEMQGYEADQMMWEH